MRLLFSIAAVLIFILSAWPAPGQIGLASASTVAPASVVASKGHVHPLCNPTVAKNVTITLTNTIASPTGAYAQKLTIPSFLYSAINQSWNNVDFIYTNGVKANAWIEAGASKNQVTTVWINQSSIGSSASRTIYMNVLTGCGATQMNGINGPTGEAPQLSGAYGANDDGRLVFTRLYDNFSGAAIKAALWTTSIQGGTVTVNNGVTIAASTSASAKPQLYSVTNFTQPADFEWYGTMTGTCSNHAEFGAGWPLINAADNVMAAFCVNTNSPKWCDISSGGTFTCGAAATVTTGSNVIHRSTSVAAAKDCFYENYIAEGCSAAHIAWSSHATATAQLGSGSISAVWMRVRDNISDQITVAGLPSTTDMIYGYVHSINRFGVQVPDSGANITAIPTVVGSRGSVYQQQTNSLGFYNLTVPSASTYTVYSNRSAAYGGDYGPVTTGATGVMANLLQYPYVGYGNSTITLPNWNTSNGYLSSCNSQVPCPGSQATGLVGMADPVIGWTSDTAYYIDSNSHLVGYSLINGTSRTLTTWLTLYQNIMNYAGIENNIWITQDDTYIYSFGCLAKCTTASTMTGEAVNVTTGRRWIWNYTGTTDNSFVSNAEVFMVGENGNESLLIIVSSAGTVFAYNIWTNSQSTMTNSVAPFEANNEWWLPSINSLIDVDCNGHTTDFIIQFQLTGAAPGTTWTNASHLQWSTNKYAIGGAFLTTFNISAHSFVVTEGLQGGASYQYAEQIVKLTTGGPTATLSGFGTTWPMTNAGGVYPNNTVLLPLVTGFEHRPNTISSGPSWAFVANNYFQNDSQIVDPQTSTWYDTNVTWTHNQTTAGCSGQCYSYRQGQIFPSADAGLFYNTTWGIQPQSYDCRTNGSSCPIDNGGTLGRIYWVWKIGSTKFPYPATAAKAQTYAPGPVNAPTATPYSATCESIGWNAPSYGTNPILNYTLFWGTSTPGLNHHQDLQNFNASGTAPGFILCGLTQGTTYYYQIEAWNMHWHNSMASLSFIAGVPQAPTNLHSTATTVSSISVAWTNPPGTVVNDTVWYESGGCGTWSTKSTAGSATSSTVTGLTSGNTYCMVVSAWNATGNSAFSNYINVTVPTVPQVPTGFTATTTSTSQINTAWTNPPGTVVNDTVWQWSSATACTGSYSTTSGTSGAATSDSITGLSAGTAYAFKVSAWNATGNGVETGCVTNTTLPNAPTSVTVSSTTTTSISLSWTNPAPTTWITDDKIFYKLGFSCASGTTTDDLGSASTSGTVSGLAQNTAYCFYVIAYTKGGGGVQSSTIEGVTATPPGQVTGLSATGVTPSRIQLSWSNPSGGGIVNDTVWRWNAGSCAGAYASTNSTGSSATTYTVGGLTSGTNYSFKVSAWNATGNGALSSCLTKETLPGPATALGANGITTTTVPLTWSNPGGGLYNDTVYRWTGSTCTGSYAQSYSAGVATSYTVTALSSATAYSFKVQVWDASGNSTLTVCTGETTLPGPVTALAVVTVTTGSIQLSWTDPGGTLANNTVYYGTTCAGATGHSTGGIATSYTASGLAWATKYCFKVSAWSAGGQGALTWINATTLPGAATGLSVTSITTGVNVGLSWTNPNGTLANDTMLAGTSCGTWTVRQSTGGATTSGTVTGLTNLTTYCFAIQVWSAGGGGATSTTVTDQPVAPTALHATGSTTTSITLGWTNSAATTVFQATLYYGTTCAFGSTQVVSGSGPVGTVSGLTQNTQYCIAVADQGFAGYSPKSTFINYTTPLQPPLPPVSLHVIAQTSNSISLSWTPPTPAPGSPVSNYTLWYGLSCTPTNAQSLGSPGTSGTVSGLLSAATYCFEAQTWSQNGQGSNLSSTAFGTTLSGGGGGGGGGSGCPFTCPAINNTTLGLNGRATAQIGFYLIVLGVVSMITIGVALMASYTAPEPNRRRR